MTGFSCLALCVAAVLSIWLSLFRFLVSLAGAIAVGVIVAEVRGVPTGMVLVWVLALGAAAQVGYVMGLAGQAVIRRED